MTTARTYARRWRRRITLQAVRTLRRSKLERLVRRMLTADVERTVFTEVYRVANREVADEALDGGRAWRWACDPDPCLKCAAYCGEMVFDRRVEPPPVHPWCRCVALPG